MWSCGSTSAIEIRGPYHNWLLEADCIFFFLLNSLNEKAFSQCDFRMTEFVCNNQCPASDGVTDCILPLSIECEVVGVFFLNKQLLCDNQKNRQACIEVILQTQYNSAVMHHSENKTSVLAFSGESHLVIAMHAFRQTSNQTIELMTL